MVTKTGREAATIVMLAAVALPVAGAAGQWSAAMIAAEVWRLRCEGRGPIKIGLEQWAGIVLGAAVIVTSFAMDYRAWRLGGGSYAWAPRAAWVR